MTAESSALPGSDRGGALEGVVVVELAQSLPGDFAGGLLADMGATVVKVEPRDGSPLRRRGPGIAGEDSLYFQSENRGKYSVVAELPELGREPWLAKLLETADAIVEDLGPGQLESFGLAPDSLLGKNARLALLRISPFGQTGPLAGERGDDRIAQAFSGMQSATVVPANVYPTRDGSFIALSGAGDQPFARLCEAIGAPEAVKDPRFATSAARLANRAAADELVRSWVAKHDVADVETHFMEAA